MSAIATDLKSHLSVVVDEAARELVSSSHHPRGSFIQTPLLYPSGAYVAVSVAGGPDRYMVSDFGAGYREAELMGASYHYTRQGRIIAERSGVRFDEHAFFVLEIARDQIAGGVAAIANCSQKAASIAAFKMADRNQSDDMEAVYERVARIFPANAITRNAEILGSSDIPWHVATLVRVADSVAIFDAVTPHHISVVNAAAKFSDILNLAKPPSRTAVVRNKASFNKYLGLLSQSSNIIELSVSDEVFKRLALAA